MGRGLLHTACESQRHDDFILASSLTHTRARVIFCVVQLDEDLAYVTKMFGIVSALAGLLGAVTGGLLADKLVSPLSHQLSFFQWCSQTLLYSGRHIGSIRHSANAVHRHCVLCAGRRCWCCVDGHCQSSADVCLFWRCDVLFCGHVLVRVDSRVCVHVVSLSNLIQAYHLRDSWMCTK